MSKKRKPKTDYQERAYVLYSSEFGSPDLVLIQRDLEQVSLPMLKAFFTLPLSATQQYIIICNQIDYGDDGYWERSDEVAMRRWKYRDMQGETFYISSGSMMDLIATTLREVWL